MVESHAPGQSLLGLEAQLGDDELVELRFRVVLAKARASATLCHSNAGKQESCHVMGRMQNKPPWGRDASWQDDQVLCVADS